jgi:hypothetical protein
VTRALHVRDGEIVREDRKPTPSRAAGHA